MSTGNTEVILQLHKRQYDALQREIIETENNFEKLQEHVGNSDAGPDRGILPADCP